MTFRDFLQEKNGQDEKEKFYHSPNVLKEMHKDKVFEIAISYFGEDNRTERMLLQEVQANLKSSLKFPRRKEMEDIMKDKKDIDYVIEYIWNDDKGMEFFKDLLLNARRKTFTKIYDLFWEIMYEDEVYFEMKKII